MTCYLLRNYIITDTAVGKLVTWVSVKPRKCYLTSLWNLLRLGCSRIFSISCDDLKAPLENCHFHAFLHDELCCFCLKHVCLLCWFVVIPLLYTCPNLSKNRWLRCLYVSWVPRHVLFQGLASQKFSYLAPPHIASQVAYQINTASYWLIRQIREVTNNTHSRFCTPLFIIRRSDEANLWLEFCSYSAVFPCNGNIIKWR